MTIQYDKKSFADLGQPKLLIYLDVAPYSYTVTAPYAPTAMIRVGGKGSRFKFKFTTAALEAFNPNNSIKKYNP